MRQSADKSIRHFLCGGKRGVANELADICSTKFGNRNCVGSYSPGFDIESEQELKEIGMTVNDANTDILWIGMSSPRQHFFAKRLARHLNAHFIVTVGAAFDFHTGRVKHAPAFVQKLGLEWFYRILVEPGRLGPRYFQVVPLFIYYAIIDIARHWGKRKG
jgi:N-acetylglucosaminyldiphosphoundecaprenol N-acetyl-beta-D-mannosaminyltransferase